MELSIKERLMLSNQFRILEALYPDEADVYSERRIAIEEGYELHYAPDHIYAETLTPEECREVLDILNMYRALHFSTLRDEDPVNLSVDDVQFPGFDGNNEGTLMGYVEYFVVKLGRFEELNTGSFNSHAQMLGRYRRMLNVWKEAANKHELTQQEAEQILNA